jgi:type IX secretion system PorP/SprF family membrane protein
MKKLIFIQIIVLSLSVILSTTVTAQDLHFSQFFNSPLTTNPANTGFIPDADYRLGAHFRNQYSSLTTNPYKTLSIFGDAQLFRDKLETGWLGVGAVLLRDEAGSGMLSSTKIYGSLAYHQMLGYSSLLTAGFNIGWANKRIDPSKLKFPDQFNGKFFDAAVPTAVEFVNNNINYLDIQVGLNYAYFPTENIYINAGYSIQHVNRPEETFFNNPGGDQIPMRHIAFINALLKVRDNVIINPNVYYTTQVKAQEFNIGMNAAYNLANNGEKQIIAGLYYRVNDALIPMVGIEYKNFRFMFSYDVTSSGLSSFNHSFGATEFNLIKKGFYNESSPRTSLCPKF